MVDVTYLDALAMRRRRYLLICSFSQENAAAQTTPSDASPAAGCRNLTDRGDSISPTEGSNIPVFGSLIAALAGCCCWVVVIIVVVGMMIDDLMMEERN